MGSTRRSWQRKGHGRFERFDAPLVVTEGRWAIRGFKAAARGNGKKADNSRDSATPIAVAENREMTGNLRGSTPPTRMRIEPPRVTLVPNVRHALRN